MTAAVVDLRSDTFTSPDAEMRAAMSAAEVGDDVWGEDPTVRRLEDEVSELLGKERAVFVPSGTMGNLCALAAQAGRGDEVIADREAHLVVYEAGGSAAVAGAQLRLLDCEHGVPTAAMVEEAVRPANIHHPRSRLLCVENTHNRRGGLAIDAASIAAAAAAAHAVGLRVHCDGARLFNAAAALDCEPAELVARCDSVSVCFSKGLGAPVGSALAGDTEFVDEARRWRKRLGGGMRQAGIIAAGALHALRHNRARLVDDHDNARLIADALASAAGVEVVRCAVPTNIVMLRTVAPADRVVAEAAAAGVLVTAMDRNLVRCMTYLGVAAADAQRAATTLVEVFDHLVHPADSAPDRRDSVPTITDARG